MMHYKIIKMDNEPDQRFLQKTMCGIEWTSKGYAHKFLDLGEAVKEQRKHEYSYIIWVGVPSYSCDGKETWGEVNRDYIERTYQNV